MKLGVLLNLTNQIEEELRKVKELGISTCQLTCWNETMFTDEMADRIQAASREQGVEITHFWCGWGGPCKWNLTEGPTTLGLAPSSYRFARLQTLLRGAEFTRKLGVPYMISHVGFIPEDPNDPEYGGLLSALRHLAERCQDQGIHFLFETGQETPVTLLRTIEDIGLDNVGINLDPANLVLYGKANPVDSLDVFGKYVRGVHAKDGQYPTNGRNLGREVPLGEGKVDFPALIGRLHQLGYEGALTIEREIGGEQQIRDIIRAKTMLESIVSTLPVNGQYR